VFHLMQGHHIPTAKSLQHFLMCLSNKDRKAMPGRSRRNKIVTTCTQTHSQAFRVNGSVSHLLSLTFNYFKHDCKDDRVNVLLAVLDHYHEAMATTLEG